MLRHGADLQLSLLPSSPDSISQSINHQVLSILPTKDLPIHPPFFPSIHSSIYVSIHPSMHASILPSIHLLIHLSTHPSIYPFTSLQLTAVVLTQVASTFLLGGFNSHLTALGALLTAPSSLNHFHSQSQPEWFSCYVDLTMILHTSLPTTPSSAFHGPEKSHLLSMIQLGFWDLAPASFSVTTCAESYLFSTFTLAIPSTWVLKPPSSMDPLPQFSGLKCQVLPEASPDPPYSGLHNLHPL